MLLLTPQNSHKKESSLYHQTPLMEYPSKVTKLNLYSYIYAFPYL
jgi:hypothetical protein